MSEFYNGNPNILKVNIRQEFTKEQIDELIKCNGDPVYFARNYCKIITLDHGLQLLDLYDYQVRMINEFSSRRFVVNLLPRQMGKTTVVAAFILHYVIFNPEKAVGILANKASVAREILARIKRMYEYLPKWMQPGIKTWNKGDIELGNDSKIIAESTSNDSVRGFSFNFMYLDEFAHVEHQAEFWESTYPVISSGDSSKLIITSTPKGLELFYKIFNEAEKGLNEFHPISVHWSEHPKRDEKWKELTLKNMGELAFSQEYLCSFLGSSGTLISGSALKSLSYSSPLIENNEGMKLYIAPEKNHRYAITVDVSRGKGLDYSAFHVIDITKMPYQQVCVFKSNMITPLDYSQMIFTSAKAYNDAAVLVEINDIGGQVADSLFYDFEYENIIYTENAGARGKRISAGFKSAERGIRTTKTVKAIGCSMLKLLVEQHQLIINDFGTIQELSTFSKKGTSYEAEVGSNDDLVMGLVLFAWMSDQQYFKELTDISTLEKLRDKTEEQLEQELTPFGFISDGHEEHETVIDLTTNPYHPGFRYF